jgi:4-amino-4-deoxy-L-arabinose transferase-like glycosyltransferase
MQKISSVTGAFASLAMYLLLPFGVIASRAFQPDPLMIFGILLALYFQIRWMENDSINNTLLAGIFTGIVILIKATSVFFVGVPLVGIVFTMGIKKGIKNWHVYLVAFLALVPALLFNILSATVGGNAGSIFGARFFPSLFIDPKWYLRWIITAKSIVNYFPLIIGLLALFLIRKKEYRVFYACLWLGYILFGYTFAYHIFTHNYYHLPLIPMVAIGFGVMFEVVYKKLYEFNPHWFPRFLIAGIILMSSVLCVFEVRNELLKSNYRNAAAYWQRLGEKIGINKSVIALTQDYGYRISYWGYINPKLWLTRGDQVVYELSGATNPEFEILFKQETEGKDLFLVTMIEDFEAQTDLHDYLLSIYPYEQGEGYYLFDLKNPIGEGNK